MKEEQYYMKSCCSYRNDGLESVGRPSSKPSDRCALQATASRWVRPVAYNNEDEVQKAGTL